MRADEYKLRRNCWRDCPEWFDGDVGYWCKLTGDRSNTIEQCNRARKLKGLPPMEEDL